MGALRDTLAARDAAIVRLMNSLAERDGKLAALQQEHARMLPMLEARTKAGTQLAAELNAARGDMGAMKSKLNSNLELLRSWEWRRGFDQNMLREMEARLKPPRRDTLRCRQSAMTCKPNSGRRLLRVRWPLPERERQGRSNRRRGNAATGGIRVPWLVYRR